MGSSTVIDGCKRISDAEGGLTASHTHGCTSRSYKHIEMWCIHRTFRFAMSFASVPVILALTTSIDYIDYTAVVERINANVLWRASYRCSSPQSNLQVGVTVVQKKIWVEKLVALIRADRLKHSYILSEQAMTIICPGLSVSICNTAWESCDIPPQFDGQGTNSHS